MTEASKLNPSPLDGFETAKPDEPIFTLQGGDPLAAPLVRIWAYLSRVRAGLRGDTSWIDAPIYIANSTSVEHDAEQVRNLLTRATEAEKISWHMDGYRRGDIEVEQNTRVNELDRLDVYDIRRRTVASISGFFSELNDFREKLIEKEFMNEELNIEITEVIIALRTISFKLEIKRGNL